MDHGHVKEPARERLLKLMQDGAWHPWQEMEAAGGMRYSARLLELRRLGYLVEDRLRDDTGKDYRLVGRGAPQAKQVKVFLDEADAVALTASVFVPRSARQAIDRALRSFQRNKERL